jgi:hypothetical protein
MKKSSLLMSCMMLIVGILFISSGSAKAEQGMCSPSDPCQNWASVDSNGVVVNVLVCQVSVCGQEGSWSGKDPSGNKLVQQTSGNPVTGDTHGTSGYIGNPDGSSVVTENNGIFTIIEGATKTSMVDGVEVSTFVSQTKRSFTYGATIGKMFGEIEMNELEPDNQTVATLTATDLSQTNLITETKTFIERQTLGEIEISIQENGLNLILSKIQTFISMLGAWVK